MERVLDGVFTAGKNHMLRRGVLHLTLVYSSTKFDNFHVFIDSNYRSLTLIVIMRNAHCGKQHFLCHKDLSCVLFK